jgi:CheY-like chemotaxis protein
MNEQKKVLVVDDDIRMHEFYAELFNDQVVTYCTSGEDAVEVMNGGAAFDLIYLDLELLGMSGFSTLDALKGIAGAKLPPVVVSSSLSDPATQEIAKSKGAAAFVPKPINLQLAISVAQKLLTGSAPKTGA